MPFVAVGFVHHVDRVNDSPNPHADDAEDDIEEELPDFPASENAKRREDDCECHFHRVVFSSWENPLKTL